MSAKSDADSPPRLMPRGTGSPATSLYLRLFLQDLEFTFSFLCLKRK